MASFDTPSSGRVPQHVAIVMDGNGRWARKRMMPRTMGHKAGLDAVVSLVQTCADRGVKYLTVFAFSSENWKRPEEEVSGLMGLVLVALSKYVAKLDAQGVRICVAGDLTAVSPQVRDALHEAMERTASNQQLTMTVAFNYGGRWDIIQACKRAMADGLTAQDLDEAALSRYMAMSHLPDPDLLIRTGGEVRLSNFLLWQSAYSELYFTDLLWPDFDSVEFDKALLEYSQRERRYGDIGDTDDEDSDADDTPVFAVGKAAC